MSKKAFLTGSFIYGEMTKNSDIDLVVFLDEDNLEDLARQADNQKEFSVSQLEYGFQDGECASLRFGKLNLICCTDKTWYKSWKKGTQKLIERANEENRNIPRDEAVKAFIELQIKYGLREPEK